MRSWIQRLRQACFGWMRLVGRLPRFGRPKVIQVTGDAEVFEIYRLAWSRSYALLLRADQALVLQSILPSSAYPRLDDIADRRRSSDWPLDGPLPSVAWNIEEPRSSWTRMSVTFVLCKGHLIDTALDQVRRAGYHATRVDVQRQGCGQPHGIDLLRSKRPGSTRRLDMAACCFLGAVAAGPLLALTLTNQGELTAAKAALEAAQARAAPVMLERNKLLARQDRLNAFKATLVRSGRASAWTNMISEVLPEQAFLTSAEVVDGQISITGEAQSASQILAAFDRVQSLQDVRFTAPVIRLESKGRDRFDLGMQTTPAEPIQ